jgi:hypothetical protein
MNQKSSLREDLKFVSWMLTGNSSLFVASEHSGRQAQRQQPLNACPLLSLSRDDVIYKAEPEAMSALKATQVCVTD